MLMTLTIPVRVLSDMGIGSSQSRAFYCRYSAVLFYITMYVSILLLGGISLDRYLKIVRLSGKCAKQRVRAAQILSVVIWVVMLSLASPNVLLSDRPLEGTNGKCISMKSEAGMAWHQGFNHFCQVEQRREMRGQTGQGFIAALRKKHEGVKNADSQIPNDSLGVRKKKLFCFHIGTAASCQNGVTGAV